MVLTTVKAATGTNAQSGGLIYERVILIRFQKVGILKNDDFMIDYSMRSLLIDTLKQTNK